MASTDLNLVRTFVAVYDSGSVTAAADILGITQPTVTHSLNRLRRTMNDELFVRSPGGVAPTMAARRAYPNFVEALNRIDAAFRLSAPFIPAAEPATFRIALSDAGEVSTLPHLANALRRSGPQLSLEVLPLDIDQVEDQLIRGEIDAFISSAVYTSRNVQREVMFTERYVVVLAEDHPRIGAEISAAALDGERHVAVRGVTGHSSPFDRQQARKVRLDAVVPRFTALPYLLANSDAVAIVPLFIAESFAASHPLRWVDSPWPMEEVEVALYARQPHSRSPSQQWLFDVATLTLQSAYPSPDGGHQT
ncbi:MAG TPA: LysR family transcriptional regulator [Dietzia timorensis]|uniref:LysR family transcriptional regulator n=1 Tax=Dietzia timorensis TaxID=499555 RepID=A0A921JXN6_9ACTN|nr:LysR family transcriptional regulator [Dietzia timorensis]HJE90440.1 LysR family transcriptional regulator [Dietzia timorensis]